MTLQEKVSILGVITTKDESGKHFTCKFFRHEIEELEKEELIRINRPVHLTGIPYSEEYWHVEVTEEGRAWVESYPEYCQN